MTIPPAPAVLKISGPPGSGKSRELAREAIRLVVEEGLSAERIRLLAITPMGEKRLNHYLAEEATLAGLSRPGIVVQQWERFCQHFFGARLDDPNLLSDGEAAFLLHGLLKSTIAPDDTLYAACQSPAYARAVYDLFRHLALRPEAAAQFLALGDDAKQLKPLQRFFSDFQHKTRSQGLLTFPNLLCLSGGIAMQDAAISQTLGREVHALLIDEAQELSHAHYRLLQHLAPHMRLVLAGSDTLSIRAYRGAVPETFRNLGEHFAAITHLPRPVCFRNNEAVLERLARWKTLNQPLWEGTEASPLQDAMQLGVFSDPAAEAQALARWIADTARQNGAPFHHFAILLRSARYRPLLLEALSAQELPFDAEGLTDTQLHLCHALYDSLKLTEALNALGWQAQHRGHPLPTVARQGWIEQANHHLQRLLLSDLPGWPDHDALLSFRVDLDDPEALLLERLLEVETLSESNRQHLEALLTPLNDYRSHLKATELTEALLDFFLTRCGEDADLKRRIASLTTRLQRLEGHQQGLHANPLSLSEILELYESLWRDEHSAPGDGIRILSAHQAQGEEWPYVALPFMSANEWPQYRAPLELLAPQQYTDLGLHTLSPDFDPTADEAALLATALCRATQRVALSTHVNEGDKPVQPSRFFEEWCRLTLGLAAAPKTTSGWLQANTSSPTEPEVSVTAETISNFEGQGLWAELDVQAEARLFSDEEALELSATSINAYMKCPRRFYYRHLLNLPEKSSDAATVGSLIHRVLELLNRQTDHQPYTAARLRELTDLLFNLDGKDAAIEAGFKERDLEGLASLSPIRRLTLYRQLLESIADLERKGYFREYAHASRIEAEKDLGKVAIPGLAGCLLKGKIDALIQHSDGRWDVLDYKTTQGRWTSKPESCEKNLRHVLAPLPEDETLSHAERFAQSDARPRDYQLPLYYLALKDHYPIRSVALQLVRPRFPDAPEQGAIKIGLDSTTLEEGVETVLDDLRRYILDPIRNNPLFAPNAERHCLSCSYQAICETDGEAD